jgi:hypothetical protein
MAKDRYLKKNIGYSKYFVWQELEQLENATHMLPTFILAIASIEFRYSLAKLLSIGNSARVLELQVHPGSKFPYPYNS